MERICPDLYGSSLGDLFVLAHLPVTDSLDVMYGKLHRMLSAYRRLQVRADRETEMVCMYLQMPTQGISVSHRSLMGVLASIFGLTVSEVKSGLSKNARVFDVSGVREDLMAFIPVFKYLIAAYDSLSRDFIDGLKLPRYKKHLQRGVYTAKVCNALSGIWDVVCVETPNHSLNC